MDVSAEGVEEGFLKDGNEGSSTTSTSSPAASEVSGIRQGSTGETYLSTADEVISSAPVEETPWPVTISENQEEISWRSVVEDNQGFFGSGVDGSGSIGSSCANTIIPDTSYNETVQENQETSCPAVAHNMDEALSTLGTQDIQKMISDAINATCQNALEDSFPVGTASTGLGPIFVEETTSSLCPFTGAQTFPLDAVALSPEDIPEQQPVQESGTTSPVTSPLLEQVERLCIPDAESSDVSLLPRPAILTTPTVFAPDETPGIIPNLVPVDQNDSVVQQFNDSSTSREACLKVKTEIPEKRASEKIEVPMQDSPNKPLAMEECANCKNKVDNERNNLFSEPLPLLITLYDEEGVSTREKGEVSIYEALVDVFSLRSNVHLMHLLDSGMRGKHRENGAEGKCLLSLCHECAFRLANLYELCQEFTQLSIRAHSFLYPIIARVTVKAELLEDNDNESIDSSLPDDNTDPDAVVVVGEVAREYGKKGHGKVIDSIENGNSEPPDDNDYYPLSPETNREDEGSDSEGGVADRVRQRMERMARRKVAGGDIIDLLEVTNTAADWLSSSESDEGEIETSDESYVESEPETKRKRESAKVNEFEELDNPADGDSNNVLPKTPRRNRAKEKLTCPKCGQQYVNRACYEKHMKRHKSKYRRIRKGAAKYVSIKEESVTTRDGDEENIPDENNSANSSENNSQSGGSDGEEDEEVIGGGRLGRQRKRWRITDEDDDWNPKKRRGRRRSAGPAPPTVEEEKVRVPCTICGNTFMSNGHLIQHMKTHTKPKNTCILCGKEYRYPSELKVHLESHQRMKEKRLNSSKQRFNAPGIEHMLSLEYSDDGEIPSPIPSEESSHLDGQTMDGDEQEARTIVTCDICKKHFRHPHFLQMHLQTHSKAIKCTQCPEVFTTPKDLREHKIAHRIERRANIEPMNCKYCSKPYFDETHLFRHQESHELPPPLFPCEICNKTFTRKQKLKLHMDTVHTTERPFRCHLCPLAYSRKDKLNAHITKAHGEELKCDLCGKSFIGEASLKVHRVKHAFEAPREFQCDQCGRKYQQLKHLKNHIKFMHRKRTANVCQTCGKTFGRASCLKKHEISHQQIGSHLCSQCGKAYKHERSLILHEQKEHLGESSYQYECSTCMKRFHRKELLQNHQVTENHMAQGSSQVLVTSNNSVCSAINTLPLPEHFLTMPSAMGEMLTLDNTNPLDLIHSTNAPQVTDEEKYRSAISAITEASMFVAQNF